MLHYVTRELHSYTINNFLSSCRRSKMTPPSFLRPLTYESLLAVKQAPIGNYIFTDLDRLSDYEIDAVTEIARAIRVADPNALISNWPNRVLGRYALLRRLYEAGLNSFEVWRLDEARRPSAYPVFIRRERDALGPESPLLANEAEYRAAIESLQESGKGLSGRMVIEFRQQPDADGVFRKYGAMYFRGRVVPQHLFMSRNWVVKSSTFELSPAMVAEEESYVFDNPHADQVRRIFELAETDFGRVDYAVVDGRIEVFEINTNPTFPRMRLEYDARVRRRVHAVQGIFSGLQDLNNAETACGLTRFRTPKPKLHRLRNRSLGRRGRDMLQLCKWWALSWLGRL